MCMKKKFFTICAIVFLGFTGCTHRECANIDLTTSSVGVIETSGNSKKSRIYFYNQNLEKTATLPLEYASLGSIFYNPVIYEDELYLIPQGKTNVKDEKKVLKIELKSGNQKIYEINQLAMNSICVNDKNIYTCNTLNGDSYINKCSKENNQVVSEKIEGVYVSKLLCSKDMLFAFATTKYGKEMNSYIYIYDAEELSFDEKIDITNYGGTHYKAILFDNNILFSNSVDSGDHPCNTVCIYSINDKTIETISFDQYYPLDLAVWDNILIVSHFDLVKREGGSISIYNLETKELNNIELGHDAEQMTINENVIYILSDKIIYQYELKDMNLYLKCKTQIKKSNEENYLSGIFYIKPESVKFTL